MNTYVLYHANCYDGFGAALAAWLKLWKEDPATVFVAVNYGMDPPPMEPGSDVYILDFSYPAAVLAELGKVHHQVTVLDHHATAEKDLSYEKFVELGLAHPTMKIECGEFLMPCTNLRIRFDMNKSGAVLAWEYFHPNEPVPLFFLYLQDRDLWQFKLTGSRELSAYLQTRPIDFAEWSDLVVDFEDPITLADLIGVGHACLRLKQQMVAHMAAHARMMLFDMSRKPPLISPATSPECFEGQFHVPVANATVFFSEVGEALLATCPEAKFAAYYMDRGDGLRQWGLRSRPDFDCSAIAKAFGGGGHPGASGFIQPIPWPEPTLTWAEPSPGHNQR